MSTYKIHTRCTNCGTKTVVPQQMLEIPKGVSIEEALQTKVCDYCGCKTLIENSNK